METVHPFSCEKEIGLPCMINNKYDVGWIYEKNDCRKRVCRLCWSQQSLVECEEKRGVSREIFPPKSNSNNKKRSSIEKENVIVTILISLDIRNERDSKRNEFGFASRQRKQFTSWTNVSVHWRTSLSIDKLPPLKCLCDHSPMHEWEGFEGEVRDPRREKFSRWLMEEIDHFEVILGSLFLVEGPLKNEPEMQHICTNENEKIHSVQPRK